ncbi:MAG TPA: DNA ligase, partial [Patescibacteria group bacterium]
MYFSTLADYFEKLENTSSRNSMTEILADLFKDAGINEIDRVMYLSLGRLAPLYEPIEFQMADKMVLKAIALAYGKKAEEVLKTYKKVGDLGKVVDKLHKNHVKSHLSVNQIYDKLYEIALEGGKGSVERKVGGLAGLLKSSEVKSARFLARIPVGNLRLGFSDLTVLDAISFAYVGDKSKRKEYEAAYHVRPDIGWLAKEIKNNKGRIGKPYPVVGTPILMARCERLNDAKTILEKAGTKVAVEPKFDGFRLQIHLKRAKEPKSQRAKSQMMTRDEKGE